MAQKAYGNRGRQEKRRAIRADDGTGSKARPAKHNDSVQTDHALEHEQSDSSVAGLEEDGSDDEAKLFKPQAAKSYNTLLKSLQPATTAARDDRRHKRRKIDTGTEEERQPRKKYADEQKAGLALSLIHI